MFATRRLSLGRLWGAVIFMAVMLSLLQIRLVLDNGISWIRESQGLEPSHLVDVPAKRSNRFSHDTPNGTIIVQLSGEMGNNLHKLAFGRGLQLMAEREYNLQLPLVLRHQEHPKWISTRRNLQKCFPNLRHIDFRSGNTDEFSNRKIEQKIWLGVDAEGLVLQGNDFSSMMKVLENLKDIANGKSKTNVTTSIDKTPQSNIHLPYVFADKMVDWHILDRYRKELLEWLEFDYESCCPVDLPEAEESVFHFRNFVTELQSATSPMGFDELPPYRTAHELLGHLQVGDKVAITTRFNNNVTQEYVQALKERGLQIRVVTGNSDTEDFCFLAKTQKELVGGQRSSFFTWAAFLGISGGDGSGIQFVRSYSVHLSPESLIKDALQLPYQWTDETLKDMWRFEIFYSGVL